MGCKFLMYLEKAAIASSRLMAEPFLSDSEFCYGDRIVHQFSTPSNLVIIARLCTFIIIILIFLLAHENLIYSLTM